MTTDEYSFVIKCPASRHLPVRRKNSSPARRSSCFLQVLLHPLAISANSSFSALFTCLPIVLTSRLNNSESCCLLGHTVSSSMRTSSFTSLSGWYSMISPGSSIRYKNKHGLSIVERLGGNFFYPKVLIYNGICVFLA